MGASRLFKEIGILIVFQIVAAAVFPLLAKDHLVPILTRTDSGQLVWSRTFGAVPQVVTGRQRIFPYDKASRRDLGRRKVRHRELLAAAASPIDTVKAVLIRISFETDRDDALSTLSTGGNFDLTSDGQSIIDPPPHNRSYFNSHMLGLRHYFSFQSCGRLEIVWDVLPFSEDESYKLSDPADYGPGSYGQWTTESLVTFFRESIEAADAALAADGYPVRIGDYDAVIVAHAGANLQSDIDFDTPNDIPSFFARLGDEDQFTVDGGATVISDGSVIPETAIQDGFTGGIAAVLAHEFGHQLGLPDLYNIDTNNPTIGAWDLMDSGGFLGALIEDDEGRVHYVEGFVASGLSAWSRTFLGWTEVKTVWTFENAISLPAVEKCPARVVKVTASGDEYFLIENRAAELDDLLTGFITDENGVIIATGNCLNCQGGIPDEPEWELTNGYDILLPTESAVPSYDGGPGVLIWHVDEGLIADRWDDNTVNSLRPFGVTLLEANGVVDLGDPSSPFGLGWYDDAYYLGNNSTLSDSTLPPSWSNWGVPTGVRVEGVSARDTLMTFGAGVRSLLNKRPVGSMEFLIPSSVLPLTGPYRSLIIDEVGRGWLAGGENPVFDLQGQQVVTPPAYAPDFDAENSNAVIVGEQRGLIHAFRDTTYTIWSDGYGWPRYIGAPLVTHPVVATTTRGTFVAAADSLGSIHLLDNEGNEAGESPINLSEGDIVRSNLVVADDSHGTATGIFFVGGGFEPSPHVWLFRWNIVADGGEVSLALAEGYPHYISMTTDEIAEEITLVGGDIDPFESGDEVYVISGVTGRIKLFGLNGLLSERTSERRITTWPALVELNGDGYLDLIYSDGYSIYAVNPSGANLTGWPRKLSEIYHLPWPAVVSSPITAIDASVGGYVIVGSNGGLLYVFDRRGELSTGSPRKVSSSFFSAIDLLSVGGSGVFSYLDVPLTERNDGAPGSGSYGTSFEWHEAPFSIENGEHSWSHAYGNTMRTSFVRCSAGGIGTGKEWLSLANNLVIYPNPARGERVRFHFTAPQSGNAYLEIMTITGELVVKESKKLSGGEDEFVVSMAGKASGIYLCRLVVSSRGNTVEAYKKFAVVR